jgi:hypothetical protein
VKIGERVGDFVVMSVDLAYPVHEPAPDETLSISALAMTPQSHH